METLESSRVCRLCGQQSGISINIFDENENHVRKINAMLPIMVHEMDLLPKHMCHRCSYKLEEFHKFYMDCLKTDAALKSQLSWMQKGRSSKEKIGVPMVHIENMNIKTEPLNYDVYELEPIVENIEYINSMANSVTFPADCIREGLTYAAFSRCRCCCDKDQSRRRTTERLCRNYKGSMSKCTEITDDSRRRAALDDACVKLKSSRMKVLARAALQDRPPDHLPCLDTVEKARTRLTSAEIKEMPALDMQNHSHDSRYAAIAETTPQTVDFSRSTMVRNLRPRRNLVNYNLTKKRPISSGIMEPSVENKASLTIVPNIIPASNVSNVTPVSDVELTQQIKVEQLDELEGRTLRPRRNVVVYYEKKKRRTALEMKQYRREKELLHCTKKCKLDKTRRKSKMRSKNKNTSSNLEMKIKQEVPDNLDNGETTSTTTGSLAKMKALTTNGNVNLRNNVNYLRTNRLQSNKFQLAKQKPVDANGTKNMLDKSQNIGRFSTTNYSPKCLRSQDTHLRNGKTRQYDYVEWSVKSMRTKKLMDAVTTNVEEVPAMLKLAESIKHYCETCNVSFMNLELFRLHVCYYD